MKQLQLWCIRNLCAKNDIRMELTDDLPLLGQSGRLWKLFYPNGGSSYCYWGLSYYKVKRMIGRKLKEVNNNNNNLGGEKL